MPPVQWGTLVALIVSFLVFWFMFSRIFFRPFLDLLSQRERRFKELGQKTEKLLQEARLADETREQSVAQARREALARRDAERRAAEAEASRIVEGAKEESRAVLESVRKQIDDDIKAAGRELETLSKTLAADLAERVLGRRLNGPSAN
ncbi:MAG TPA: ATP synthase F0 subunit B [Candidatus Binataceae bacterium]|nr:ATP synthase F0 subunit B [Candidatus Binataceae bacterium]